MTGESDLENLLKAIKPKINIGNFVFCTTKNLTNIDIKDAVLIFKKEEGISVVLKKNCRRSKT